MDIDDKDHTPTEGEVIDEILDIDPDDGDEFEPEVIDDDIGDYDDDPAPETPEDGDEGDDPDARDWEKEARDQGWSPKGKKSAEQFVRDGERYAPTQKRKFERQLAEQKADFDRRLESMERMNKIGRERDRAAIKASYETAKQNAVEIADVEGYNALQAGEAQALEAFDKETEAAVKANPVPRKLDQSVIDWREENAWFDTPQHAAESQYAVNELTRLHKQYPDATVDQLIPHVDNTMRSRFPELYGDADAQPRRRAPRQLNDRGGNRRRAKPRRKLPPEAMAAAKQFVADGLFKSFADYEKEYWGQADG